MKNGFGALILALFVFMSGIASSEEITVEMKSLKDQGKKIGMVTLKDSEFGLLLIPQLSGLTPGLHGFHVHQNPDCSSALRDGKSAPGMAAGGHYDPAGTNKHEGPYGKGHLGDLPALFVNQEGKAELPVLAPRLKTADVKGHSLIIHAGGDNYSDKPELGGGGGRIACGVIQ